jgi:hypothetical protein
VFAALLLVSDAPNIWSIMKTQAVKPNRACFNNYMMALCRDGSNDQVEPLFVKMLTAYDYDRDPDLAPDHISFHTVLRAMSQNATVEVARRCDRYLWLAKTLAEQGNSAAQPDYAAYVDTMLSWSQLPGHEALDRIVSLLDEMRTLGLEIDANARRAIVTAWDVNDFHLVTEYKQPNDYDPANKLLRSMVSIATSRNFEEFTSFRIKRKHFETVLKALCNSEPPIKDIGKAGESIISLMQDLSEKYGWDVAPNLLSLSLAIRAWGQSLNHPEAVERSLEIFKDLQVLDEWKTCKLITKANTFKDVTRALAFSGRADAINYGEMIYDDMVQCFGKQRVPSAILRHIYVNLLIVCGHSNRNNRLQQAEGLIHEMKSQRLPFDTIALKRVVRKWTKSDKVERDALTTMLRALVK